MRGAVPPRPAKQRLRAVAEPGAEARSGPARRLYQGAAALSFSVFADSAVEHYRGGFYNPAMYVGPTVSALALGASLSAVRAGRRGSAARTAIFGTAAVAGLVGAGFHVRNVLKREGGLSWLNLFYGAPIGAPLGATFAGLFGLAAERLSSRRDGPNGGKAPARRSTAGELLGLAAAAGLLGTAAEAGLLHFRGAFQDPFMYIPVTVPPLAAVALGRTALRRAGGRSGGVARTLLWTTAATGFVGMGFHAYGIHRNMGGWRNWMQMIQQGPPVPAPPSFTGMALAGIAALDLMDGAHG